MDTFGPVAPEVLFLAAVVLFSFELPGAVEEVNLPLDGPLFLSTCSFCVALVSPELLVKKYTMAKADPNTSTPTKKPPTSKKAKRLSDGPELLDARRALRPEGWELRESDEGCPKIEGEVDSGGLFWECDAGEGNVSVR